MDGSTVEEQLKACLKCAVSLVKDENVLKLQKDDVAYKWALLNIKITGEAFSPVIRNGYFEFDAIYQKLLKRQRYEMKSQLNDCGLRSKTIAKKVGKFISNVAAFMIAMAHYAQREANNGIDKLEDLPQHEAKTLIRHILEKHIRSRPGGTAIPGFLAKKLDVAECSPSLGPGADAECSPSLGPGADAECSPSLGPGADAECSPSLAADNPIPSHPIRRLTPGGTATKSIPDNPNPSPRKTHGGTAILGFWAQMGGSPTTMGLGADAECFTSLGGSLTESKLDKPDSENIYLHQQLEHERQQRENERQQRVQLEQKLDILEKRLKELQTSTMDTSTSPPTDAINDLLADFNPIELPKTMEAGTG